jgi:hypothetical protein
VELQKKMFSALVDVFFVPMLEVDYRAVSNLLDKGVLMDIALVEKFSRQMIYKLVGRRYCPCGDAQKLTKEVNDNNIINQH